MRCLFPLERKHLTQTRLTTALIRPPPHIDAVVVTGARIRRHRRAVTLAVAATVTVARVPQAVLVVGFRIDHGVAGLEEALTKYPARATRPMRAQRVCLTRVNSVH